MSLPDGMSHVARTAPRTPRTLLVVMALLLVLGAGGLLASIEAARTTQAASKADVKRNEELLQKIRELQVKTAQNTDVYRQRNEVLHADLCRLVYAAVQGTPPLRMQGIEPCRRAGLVPVPPATGGG